MSTLLKLLRSVPVLSSRAVIMTSATHAMDGPVMSAIHLKLEQRLTPTHLQVINESYMHAVPPGSETHFKVVVVSERFEGIPLLQRHRMVNDILKEELATRIHALSVQAKTPRQWGAEPHFDRSPACLGGSKHDPNVAVKLEALSKD
ncbi:bolA-like protein 1 [Hemiscyllium ocellatum]|uniref:bolA-like protein 1 n=1 Tax=Hemiscyllium ocellatum TaxID=170820 RepID=UPI0029661FB8|nr:bolA-like protein 1 [Hemiscyllium ocellatum]